MAVKNGALKDWSAWALCGDGRKWSTYPAGDKPGFMPVILLTDWVAGPTTGGEGNNGCFLTIYGYNLGKLADYVAGLNHVTIGGVEVANYRCLVLACGSGTGTPGRGVGDTWGVQCLTVQVGALGSPTPGTALKIDITVKGNHPVNATDGSGNYLSAPTAYDGTRKPLTFARQPGPIYFVDRVNGSDSNDGLTPSTPLKTVQGSTGFTGIFKCGANATDTTGMKPGTHVYDMGGTANGGGLNSFHAYLFRISGTPANGATNRGPICYTRYPGAVGANSPAAVTIQGVIDGSGNGGGGFHGNDQARAGETCPFDGVTGWGRQLHISNVKIISSANAARDGAPVSLESGGDGWRVINCDLSWPWVSSVTNVTNCAGINGNGVDVLCALNYIHDIQGVVSDNQQHGIYMDGSLNCTNGWINYKNCIYRVTAGNGIQTYNSQAAGTIQNIANHGNWIELVNKHGLNASDSTATRADWNNVVLFSGEAAYNMSTASVTTSGGIRYFNNTFYGWARVGNTRPAVWNQGGTGAGGSTDGRNNVFCQAPGYSGAYAFTSLDNSGTNNQSKNRWFDPNGTLTAAPSSDSTGTYGDPKFNAPSSGDFGLQSGSPCIDAATAALMTRATDFFDRTITGTADIGALEYGAHL
jgi:hypothetical protein